MKQSHWLLCAAKNFDWFRKIMPLSNMTRASLVTNKLTAKAEFIYEIYKS